MYSNEFQKIIEFRRSNRKFDASIEVPDDVIRKSLERAVLSPNSSNMQLWEFYWLRTPEIKEKFVPLCLGQQAAKTAKHMVVFVTRRDKWKERAAWNIKKIKESVKGEPDVAVKRAMDYYGKVMPLVYMQEPLGLMTILRKSISFFAGLFKPFYRSGGSTQQKVVVHKSCALAAQTFMLSIAAEGFHSCPMEGFDANALDALLNLKEKGLKSTAMLTLGYRNTENDWLVNLKKVRRANNDFVTEIK